VGAGCAGAPFCPFGAAEFAELAAELFASDEFVVEVAG
jgi:sulfite reductase beta subunit-like hemoprotein